MKEVLSGYKKSLLDFKNTEKWYIYHLVSRRNQPDDWFGEEIQTILPLLEKLSENSFNEWSTKVKIRALVEQYGPKSSSSTVPFVCGLPLADLVKVSDCI